MFVLGYKLAAIDTTGKDACKIENKHFYGASVVKLIIFPVIGFGVMYFCFSVTSFVSDPVLCFVLFLQFATPTALNLVIISTVHKNKEQETAKFMLIQYIISTLTLTICVALIFLYLNS